MAAAISNWLGSLEYRADFYARRGGRRRKDHEFDWQWFESRPSGRLIDLRQLIKRSLYRIGLSKVQPISREWLRDNADRLWNTRCMFGDELSRLLFDEHLVLKTTNHRRFYYPRTEFEDLLDVLGETPFRHDALPHEYLGLPLVSFDVRLEGQATPFKMITTASQLGLLNSYRQYLPRRNDIEFSPRLGEVVLDCGACIGEISILFAAFVGVAGQVHLFDPVPLHSQFSQLQADLNPHLAPAMHINTLAVGDRTFTATGGKADNNRIEPGAIPIDAFSTTTMDDYCADKRLGCVDFIKMDIEGAELSALNGASGLIRESKPRLAISAYHKPDDLWVLADRIKALHPGYQLSFGHHSPIQWESVIYAM
jgi:FkbM family methyltransferase